MHSDGSKVLSGHHVEYTRFGTKKFHCKWTSLSLPLLSNSDHMLTRHSLNNTTPIYTQHFLFTNIATHYKKTLITEHFFYLLSLISLSLSLTRIPVFFGSWRILLPVFFSSFGLCKWSCSPGKPRATLTARTPRTSSDGRSTRRTHTMRSRILMESFRWV